MLTFIRTHLMLPLLLLAIALVGDAYLDLDERLADLLFNWEGGHWSLQHAWLTETVLHEGGRWLAGLMLLTMLSALALSFWHRDWRPYRNGLVYLTVSILICFAMVNGLKAVSGTPCPWDLLRYGGGTKLHHWFTGFSGEHGCFPAGHASGGYVWVALYFYALAHHFERRYHLLAIGIVMGVVFGIGQQLRGAHFLSHDLVTLAICWFTSLSLFLLWFRNKPALIRRP